MLVALVLLAEYGAFEILGYQTFTTEIFTEFQVSFNVPTACALSLVLVAAQLVVLGGEVARPGPGARRPAPGRSPSACRRATGSAGHAARAGRLRRLVVLALGVPVGASVYWMFEGGRPPLAGVSLLNAAWHTAALQRRRRRPGHALALPVALLAVRHRGASTQLLERSTYLVLAMPGLVIALALSYFSERYADGFALPERPAADRRLRDPVLPAGPRRGPGVGGPRPGQPRGGGPLARADAAAVLLRVTLPLIAPGLAAAFCLVFLAAVTELTATLILVPTGVQTLATQFWAYQQNLSYGQAAPFAL